MTRTDPIGAASMRRSPAQAARPHEAAGDLAADVAAGLGASRKRLSSRYFYDDRGSMLFQQIMALPEYYLTRVEREILVRRGADIARRLVEGGKGVDVIELGSGDGAKTIELCRALIEIGADAAYHPIDTSAHALAELRARFESDLARMPVSALCGDYFQSWPATDAARRQVAMFLGSNIGNLSFEESVRLLSSIRSRLAPGDLLLLGVDLEKDPATILRAYDDAGGITAQFNLNLLARLNRELGMDFAIDRFGHYATYNPLDGAARSFLVSRAAQTVRSRILNLSFSFAEGEAIFVEQSQKYTRETIAGLARAAGFSIDRHFGDARGWYDICVLRFDGAA